MNTHCVEPLETSENFSSSEMLPEPDEHELESTVGGDVVGPPEHVIFYSSFSISKWSEL